MSCDLKNASYNSLSNNAKTANNHRIKSFKSDQYLSQLYTYSIITYIMSINKHTSLFENINKLCNNIVVAMFFIAFNDEQLQKIDSI